MNPKIFTNGEAAKGLVALIGFATTFLSHYSGAWWEPTVVAALTFLGVVLVPNTPKAPPPPTGM